MLLWIENVFLRIGSKLRLRLKSNIEILKRGYDHWSVAANPSAAPEFQTNSLPPKREFYWYSKIRIEISFLDQVLKLKAPGSRIHLYHLQAAPYRSSLLQFCSRQLRVLKIHLYQLQAAPCRSSLLQFCSRQLRVLKIHQYQQLRSSLNPTTATSSTVITLPYIQSSFYQ